MFERVDTHMDGRTQGRTGAGSSPIINYEHTAQVSLNMFSHGATHIKTVYDPRR